MGERERAIAVLGEAAETARLIASASYRSQMLAAIGCSLAAAGAHRQGEALAEDIASPWDRANVLTTLAKLVEPTWARSLTAQALCIGKWATTLDNLAAIEPSALIEVAAQMR